MYAKNETLLAQVGAWQGESPWPTLDASMNQKAQHKISWGPNYGR